MSGLQLPSLSPPPSPGFVDRQLAAEESQTARVQSYSWDVAVSTSRFEDLSQQVSEQEQVVGDIRAVQTGMAPVPEDEAATLQTLVSAAHAGWSG